MTHAGVTSPSRGEVVPEARVGVIKASQGGFPRRGNGEACAVYGCFRAKTGVCYTISVSSIAFPIKAIKKPRQTGQQAERSTP